MYYTNAFANYLMKNLTAARPPIRTGLSSELTERVKYLRLGLGKLANLLTIGSKLPL